MSEHGTHSRYVQGCRCSECRAARTRYMREYRARQRVQKDGLGAPEVVEPSDCYAATTPTTIHPGETRTHGSEEA